MVARPPGSRPSKNGQRTLGAYHGPMVMKRKGSAVATEGAAQSVLRRGTARELTAEEERVMRMRLGASPPRAAPLGRAADGDEDLEIELRAAEIEAWLRWKAHAGEQPARAPAAAIPSRTKEKIIRALRT
jgi:hypothetical protein